MPVGGRAPQKLWSTIGFRSKRAATAMPSDRYCRADSSILPTPPIRRVCDRATDDEETQEPCRHRWSSSFEIARCGMVRCPSKNAPSTGKRNICSNVIRDICGLLRTKAGAVHNNAFDIDHINNPQMLEQRKLPISKHAKVIAMNMRRINCFRLREAYSENCMSNDPRVRRYCFTVAVSGPGAVHHRAPAVRQRLGNYRSRPRGRRRAE